MNDIKRFNHIVEAIKHLEPNHVLGKCLERNGMAFKSEEYRAIRMPDGRVAFLSVSGGFTCYRGENTCFPSCKASIYRLSGRDNRIMALLKTYDFLLFLESLPEVQDFIREGYYYEPWALAQHYEFATPMIDLSNELAVAAFFATHYYDRVSKEYRVVTEGVGRIRGVSIAMAAVLDGPLKPIGQQPFARPGRQDGYGYWISEQDDFANHSFMIEFTQNKDVNLRLKTAMMDGTDYYFPNEQISQMASIIKNTNAVTRTAIEKMLADIDAGNSYIKPTVERDDIDRVIKTQKVFIVDAPVICPEAMPHQINAFMNSTRLLVLPAYRN